MFALQNYDHSVVVVRLLLGNLSDTWLLGQDGFVQNWRLIDDPVLFLLISIYLVGLGFHLPCCSKWLGFCLVDV